MMPLEVEANRQRRWFTANGHLIAFDTDIWADNIPALRDADLLDQYADLLHIVAMILGADQTWAPTENSVALQLTHTLLRSSDPAHQLALSVPTEAVSKLAGIAEALEGELCVVAHRQRVVLSTEVPPFSAADALALRSPGAMLLLGDIVSDGYKLVLRSDSSRYICRSNAESSTLEILSREEVSHEAQDKLPGSQCSELRFLERPECDIRALVKGRQIKSPVNLRAGLRVEVHVADSSAPAIVVPGTVVRLGQSLAFRTDEDTTKDEATTTAEATAAGIITTDEATTTAEVTTSAQVTTTAEFTTPARATTPAEVTTPAQVTTPAGVSASVD